MHWVALTCQFSSPAKITLCTELRRHSTGRSIPVISTRLYRLVCCVEIASLLGTIKAGGEAYPQVRTIETYIKSYNLNLYRKSLNTCNVLHFKFVRKQSTYRVMNIVMLHWRKTTQVVASVYVVYCVHLV